MSESGILLHIFVEVGTYGFVEFGTYGKNNSV